MKHPSEDSLSTYAENTWCPGCGNFGLLTAIKTVLKNLKEKEKLHQVVLVSGIGCHGKIVDYLAVNSFYSIHGRVIPVAWGIKMANPELIVIGHAGDGDAYGEGIAHLIFAAKRNTNLTLLVHNNRVYGLTTGQFTPTSPKGFPGRSTPTGNPEEPLNPIKLMLASGATFVARGYVGRPNHLAKLIREAIEHEGFAFIDVLQPCYTFFNTYQFYNKHIVEIPNEHPVENLEKAFTLADQWDYSSNATEIPIGIFYRYQKPTYEKEALVKGTYEPDLWTHLKKFHQ